MAGDQEHAKKLWRGHSADIDFEPKDFEVLDLALNVDPELRLSALAVKRARQAGLKYPVTGADDLAALFDRSGFRGGGHTIVPADAAKYMPAEFFPIAHEGELVSRIYIALRRCNHEASLALSPATPANVGAPDPEKEV
jgi:hypothetical protein